MAQPASTIRTIDCQYVQPQFAAAFLVAAQGRAVFVENNTAHSVPILLDALRDAGIPRENVDYLVITLHLDHAGGTSRLLEACPNATVLAHPRAAPHVIDPSRLVASARKVYGDEAFERLYGEIRPIPAGRVRSMSDGEPLEWQGRELRFLHTRGHANHHFCLLLPSERAIFTGDSFGLAYPRLQSRGLFIFPSTSPTDFDPEEARKSVKRIAESGATSAYLTHFGEVRDLAGAARQLVEHLDFSEETLEAAVRSPLPDAELDRFCGERLRKHLEAAIGKKGIPMDSSLWDLVKMDIELNGAGIAHVARKRRGSKA